MEMHLGFILYVRINKLEPGSILELNLQKNEHINIGQVQNQLLKIN